MSPSFNLNAEGISWHNFGIMCDHTKPQRPFKSWLGDWHISKCAEHCTKKVDISKHWMDTNWVLGYKDLLVDLHLVTFTNKEAETDTIRIASRIYSGLNKAFKDLRFVVKLVFESHSPKWMLFRRLHNQPVVSKQLAGVPNSSTSPSLPPQQSFCSSVNSPLKGVEDFLDMGIYWSLLLS